MDAAESAVDVAWIAKRIGLSVCHVRDRVVRSPGFPSPYRIGASRRWEREDIERWLSTLRAQEPRRPGRPRKQPCGA